MYNITNHPSTGWSEAQRAAALELTGSPVIDIRFPNVSPNATSKEVEEMAWEVLKDVPRDASVLIQGEASLSFALIMVAFVKRCRVYSTTTERVVVERAEGDTVVKTAVFQFVQFRDLLACGYHAMNCIIQEGL